MKRYISILLVVFILISPISEQAFAVAWTETYDQKESSFLSEAHELSLASLMNQLSTEGITIPLSGQDIQSLQSPSKVEHKTRISYELISSGQIDEADPQSAIIRFTLENPGNEQVSFDYKFISGSSYIEKIEGEDSGNIFFDVGETEKELEIKLKPWIHKPTEFDQISDIDEFWTGERIFFLYCNNIQNALFLDGKRSETIAVPIESSFNYESAYENASDYLFDLEDLEELENLSQAPQHYRYETNEIKIKVDIKDDVRTMVDMGVFTHIELPRGYIEKQNEAKGNAYYRIDRIDIFGGSSTVKNEELILEDKTEVFFGGEERLSDLGLGRNLESNVMCSSLQFTLDYSSVTEAVYTHFDNPKQVRFSDQEVPIITGIKIPFELNTGVALGDRVPIILSYNEPVYTDNISIKLDGEYYYPIEEIGTISESVTFLYEIHEEIYENHGQLIIEDIRGAKDLSLNKQKEEVPPPAIHFNLKPTDFTNDFFYCADPIVTLEQGTDIQPTATISIPLKQHTDLSNWISEKLIGDENLVSVVQVKVIGQDGEIIEVPLYAHIEGRYITKLVGQFNPWINLTDEDIHYLAEIYLKDSSGFQLVYGLTAEYTVPPVTFITSPHDLEIIYSKWPATNKIIADSEADLSLDYIIKVNATWKDSDYYQWESSDDTVATIDRSSGLINLTGKAGSVNFILVATNLGLADEVELISETLTVMPKVESFLSISPWGRNIESVQGQDVRIEYSTNIPFNNVEYGGSEVETIFTYTLYEASYEDFAWEKGEMVYREQMTFIGETASNYILIPNSYLTNTTSKDGYSYIVELSTEELRTGENYKDEAKIRVKPLPAKAILDLPDSFYITDASSQFNVSFDIENRNHKTDYLLTVKKNNESTPLFSVTSPEDLNKTHSIPIENVVPNALLDIYTVSLKAKNELDEIWSYDSYILYVYNRNALKILVDGRLVDELEVKPAYDFSNMDSNEIINNFLANRKVQFYNKLSQISIDKNNYKWSNIADKLTWEVGSEGNLILKHNAVIVEDNSQLFLPGTSLVLEAIDSGTSSVSVSHYGTGMKTTLPVIVEEKPIDKLYIFYTYPQTKCLVTYTNKKNQEKTMETDHWGRLGVYEESGIASDVIFHPIDKGEVYGTTVLKYSQLLANQNSINTFDLYPQNTVKLLALDKYNVNLKLYEKDGGAPFTEDIIIRGGVYINGEYRQYIKINGKEANEDQTVSPINGIYHLAFNPLEFTDVYGHINPGTEIEYKIEVTTSDYSHYPLMIELGNNEIRNTDNSSKGIYINRNIQELKSNTIESNIIISAQSFVLNGKKYNFDNNLITMDRNVKEAKINMDLIIPNVNDGYYYLGLVDKYGQSWGGAYYKPSNIYPFSRAGVLNISLKIDSYLEVFLANRTEKGDVVHLYPIIRNEKEGIEIKLSNPLRLQNLILPSMDSSNNWDNDVYDVQEKFFYNIKDSGNYKNIGANDQVKEILDFLSHFNAGFGNIGLEITPTEDPLVYKGKIRFSIGSYSRDNPSGLFVTQGETISYNFLPGFSDLKAMSKGEYIKQSKKSMKEAQAGSLGRTYGGGTYIECQIFYNKKKGKWDLRIVKSDTYIGGGAHYSRIHNTSIGGFPVTAEFKTGVTTEIGLKTVYDSVNDSTAYITELRPNGYIYGFGGAGFDLKAVAVKAGPYGQINHEQRFLWYDFEELSKNGQRLSISGSTGLEFKLQFLLFSVRGKYELLSAGKSWTYNDFAEIDDVFKSGKIIRMNDSYYLIEGQEENEIANSNISFQDRSYLNNHRSWDASGRYRIKGFDRYSSEDRELILANAYPFSNPILSEDSKVMVYLHDMDSTDLMDTAVNFTVRDSLEEGFSEGREISESDFPDIDARIAGNEEDAVVVWTRIFTEVGQAGKEASDEDIANVLDATEIMVAVYDPIKKEFETKQLTNNSSPDIAPIVAVGEDRAIVAWRSVIPGDREDPMDFTARDEILFSIFDGEDWSIPRLLYDGIVDHVEDLKVGMLADGSTAILYQVKKEGGSSEIFVTLLDKYGEVKTNLRLTNDDIQDKNIEIAVVEIEEGVEGFVMAWNKENTIQILVMDGKGNLYKELEQEIGNPSETVNYSDFSFVKGAKKIEDLSIIWAEADISSAEGSSDIYKDNIWGIKLIKEVDGTIGHSGKIKLLELDKENTADFYDVVKIPERDELQFILLVTDHSSTDEKVDLLMAKSTYQNEIFVDEPIYLYEDIIPGMSMPIAFNIKNLGIEPIDEITINIGDETYTSEDIIKSGMEKEILVFFTVPDSVSQIDYSIIAKYPNTQVSNSGVLRLDLVDLSIDRITLTKEEARERGFNVLLSNKAYGELKEGIHTVRLEIYKTADFHMTSPIVEETISDGERLKLMNEGALPLDIVLDEEDLQEFLDENGELPEGGALVFFNLVVTEKDEVIEDAEIGNDMDYIVIPSLLEKYGSPINIASMVQNVGGKAEVKIEAFNNSINRISNGNFIAVLKDEKGNIIEKQQSYNPDHGSSSLIHIQGEASFSTKFNFEHKGSSADLFFTEINENSAKLSMLKMSGLKLDFEKDIYQYDIDVMDLKETIILAEAEDPKSVITIKKDGSPIAIAEPIPMSYGINRFVISVVNGEEKSDYIVNVRNLSTEPNEPGKEDGGGTWVNSSEKDPVDSTITALINGMEHKISIKNLDGKVLINFALLEDILFEKDENIEISIPEIYQAKSYSLELPLGLMTSSGKGLIILDTHLASMKLARNSFYQKSEGTGKTVSITIESGDRSLLAYGIREAIGERPFTRLTILIDGKETNWQDYGKKINISIPYTLTDDEFHNSESIVIWHIDESGKASTIANGVYDTSNRTINFHTNYLGDYGLVYKKVKFKDVANDMWYSKAINFIAARDITAGTGNGKFSPNDKLTRGQFITMIMRAYGVTPDIDPMDNFLDAGSTYYTNYLAKAKALGISQGVGNNRYEPEKEISRQEMFLLLYNVLKVMDSLPEGSSGRTIADFTDTKEIESWAKEALTLLVEAGVISGSSGKLNPTSKTTRAELAQVLFNILSK